MNGKELIMENQKIYDIAIIGLGPAGSTFARLLNDKYSIIAFDKKLNYDNGFRKPCGGLLADDAQRFFAKFGLTLPLDVLVDPQIFSVKTIDLNTDNIRYYQRFYMNMDRHKFDLWQKSLIGKNVEVKNDVVCFDIEKENGLYKICVLNGDKTEYYYSKYLVGADGADSIVRKKIYPDKKISSYIAIQQWFEDKHETPFYSCIFDKKLTNCYAWGLSKNNKFIFGGAFPIKTGKKNFEIMKEKLKKFNFKLENPIKTEACIVLCPSTPFQFCLGKENAFLIGEAAGFISPSSLEGISYAFESAYILSKIFDNKQKISVESYKKATFGIRFKLSLKLVKNIFIYCPFVRNIIMKSAVQSINVINENYYEE